ncbi:hypothetical protein QYR09_15050 [Cellulophaga lytica]|nr:hypothetical protein QYR09_15050 [Cellulophaga lytica]
MTYQEAEKLVELNQHLIGKKIIGATIEELVIYPTKQNFYDQFIKTYIRTLDGKKSIIPFKNEDVDIHCIVDKKMINVSGILGHVSLHKVDQEHEVIFE